MKYTGTKYSEAEARAIMIEARATVALVHADMQRWKAEQNERDGADRFVTKTVDHARVADAPQEQTMDAQTASWVEWVEAGDRIVTEVCGEAHGRLKRDVQAALRQRDAEIRMLKREVASLRNEVDLKL